MKLSLKSATGLIVAGFVVTGSMATGAPPPNDNFADRINLGSVATVATTGSNVDATMEAGEDEFGGIAGSSVWYEWTAPTTGWVTVFTYGSQLNTVIGIHTGGTSIATLTRGGFNDGDFLVYNSGFGYPSDFDPDAGNHPSRLYFRAQAGTAYKIAVCGWKHGAWGPDENTFNFNIEYETPGGQVTSVTINPDPVNVTASSQTVTVTVSAEIASPHPGGVGTVLLYPPGSTPESYFDSAWQFASISSGDRISGTANSGTYQVDVTIPRYAVPGEWIADVNVLALDGSGDSHSWQHGSGADLMEDFVIALPAQDTRLTVQNTGPSDSAGPVLQTFSVNPASANVTASNQTVTVTMRITDNVSGLRVTGGVLVALRTSSFEVLSNSIFTRTSGDALDGIYETTIDVPQGFPGGVHYWGLELMDETGNRRAYSEHPALSDNVFPSGISPTYPITGSVGYDAWKYGKYFGFPTEDGLLDDPNDDGTTNLACYAFNIYPGFGQATVLLPGGFEGLPRITMLGGGPGQRLAIEFIRRKASTNSGLAYLPQFGDSLAESGPGSFTNAAGTPTIESIDSIWEKVTIEDSVTGTARRFGRVKISYTPPSP